MVDNWDDRRNAPCSSPKVQPWPWLDRWGNKEDLLPYAPRMEDLGVLGKSTFYDPVPFAMRVSLWSTAHRGSRGRITFFASFSHIPQCYSQATRPRRIVRTPRPTPP